MNFKVITIQAQEEFSQVLQAELGELGFNSFMEQEEGFETAIEEDLFDMASFEEKINFYRDFTKIEFQLRNEAKQNWNKLWEENFQPITIDEICIVRAEFHPEQPEFKYNIIVTPKMSFGTGHHQTTRLMVRNQLTISHQDKTVLDLGCGTGILGIMAAQLGAKSIDACDIDAWAVENTLENAEMNKVKINAKEGTVQVFSGNKPFDIVLANINRNILLDEMESYSQLTKTGGNLLLSGFYSEDVDLLKEKAAQFELKYLSQQQEDNWVSIIFGK
jgi:ribosomal protein L11 methyltransferase